VLIIRNNIREGSLPMADVYRAYEFLNRELNLNLTPGQLSVVERGYKAEFAQRNGFRISPREIDNWEFFSYITPRTSKRRAKAKPKTKKA